MPQPQFRRVDQNDTQGGNVFHLTAGTEIASVLSSAQSPRLPLWAMDKNPTHPKQPCANEISCPLAISGFLCLL